MFQYKNIMVNKIFAQVETLTTDMDGFALDTGFLLELGQFLK